MHTDYAASKDLSFKFWYRGTVAKDRLRKYVARGGFVYQNSYINVVYEMHG